VAVADVSGPEMACWQPDGTGLWRMANPAPEPANLTPSTRSLVLAVSGWRPEEALQLELTPPAQEPSPRRRYYDGGLLIIPFTVPLETSELTLRLGVESGQWQDTDIAWDWNSKGGKFMLHLEQIIRRSGQRGVVSLGAVYMEPGRPLCAIWTWQAFPRGWFGRLVAVDETGKIHEGQAPLAPMEFWETVQALDRVWDRVSFDGVDSKRIKEFRLQLSPCRWVEIQHVALQPAAPQPLGTVPSAVVRPTDRGWGPTGQAGRAP
jgi:hypothetical protein